ncbi:MAG: Rne/Rng family ribonuclease [Xanthobacteraceae bacterium]
MANKMLIDATHPEETRVVVVRGNRVEEFDFESADRKQLRGNIYLAKVTRVEPSLQAAFVDYGGNRHGFLAFSEIHPDYYQIPVADRQALIDEEERAHRAEEDEADNRARGRHGHRSRNAGRSREAVRSQPLEAGHANGEFSEPASEGEPNETDSAGQTLVPDEMILPSAAEGFAAQESTEPSAEAEAFPAEPMPDETLPREDTSTAVAYAAEAGGTHDDTTSFLTETQPEHELGSDGAPTNGNGIDETADEEEVVESVGGADAMEEVPERMPRLRRQYKIQEVIKRRQVMLVQVVKEERGTKGAALTTYLSLAGRYSVLMPNTARGGGISRKITNALDRKRLKETAEALEVPEGMGVILRTAGANRTKTEIKRDFEYLLRLWETVRDLTLKSTAPKLVYEEGSLVKRSIRDLYNKDIDEVIVAGDDAYRDAKDFMRMLMPSHAKNVKPYKDTQPLLARYGIESQLDAMFSPVVQLRSGGYIVLNQAEALVAIDVNSGRATREHHIEDTALKTNMEAAEEVARQLRLRDLAGLIVIDFIDMDEKRNNRSVERRLKECLKHDRARIQVGRISHFGLLEMSRQRIRTGVLESSTEKCPHCGGTGHVRSVSSVALQLLRSIEDMLIKGATHNLITRTRAEVALYVLNQKRAHLRELEERFRVTLSITADESIGGAQSFVIEKGEQVHSPEEARALAIQPDSIVPISEVDEEEEEETEEGEELVEAGEGEEANGESSPDGEHEESGDPSRRRRRRRRRGRRGGEGREPGAFTQETVVEHGASQADNFELGAVEGDQETATEHEPAGAAEASEEARANNGERRRRRRGRRGGRRNRPGHEEGAPAQSHEPWGERDFASAVPAEAAEPTFPSAASEGPSAPAHPHSPYPNAERLIEAALPQHGAAASSSHAEEAPPASTEAPRRGSTVREPAPTLANGPVQPPDQPQHPAEPPAPVIIGREESGDAKPRRTGWWARRLLGDKG